MTIKLYFECGAMFLLGEALYLFWIKFPSFKERAEALNKKFSYAEWWECDKNLMIGLNILPLIVFMGLDELINFKPEIINNIKWYFVVIGFAGATIGFKLASRFANGQLKLTDIYSNIAAIVMGQPAKTVTEAIEKGTAATGQDVTKAPEIKK